MTSMGLPTTSEVLDAIEHLPGGATLVLPQVSWDDYELLLDEFAERHLRVTYDCGTLEIMSPQRDHETYSYLHKGPSELNECTNKFVLKVL